MDWNTIDTKAFGNCGALMNFSRLLCFSVLLLPFLFACKKSGKVPSEQSKMFAIENQSIDEISQAVQAGFLTVDGAVAKLQKKMLDSGKITSEDSGALNLSSSNDLGDLKINTLERKQALCVAVKGVADTLKHQNLFAYTNIGAYLNSCPLKACTVDLRSLGMGLIPNQFAVSQSLVYDFKGQTFSVLKSSDTSFSGAVLGGSAFGSAGFFWRKAEDEKSILDVFGNKVGFSLGVALDVKEASLFFDPASSMVIRFLSAMFGINAVTGISVDVIAKQGQKMNPLGAVVNEQPETIYKNGIDFFFEEVLQLSKETETSPQNSSESFVLADLLNRYRGRISDITPPHISGGVGLLASVVASFWRGKKFMEEPPNIGITLNAALNYGLSGILKTGRQTFSSFASLPVGSFRMGQLNWFPLAAESSPLMDTSRFFGLDRTSLVSKKEDLGASYIKFPSPLHMFAHMLQTGNTSAMFLYIMYLEVQLHSKIGKWVTKPTCRGEDRVP